ncbi:hydantoinase/oxoprolinase family protein [bacterium]|nr:hydantoinase/oxoprolinase family protein [bacterium]
MIEIAIDTGGTFTDSVLIDEDQNIRVAKYPTNIMDPSVSILGCLKLLSQECDWTEQELIANTDTIVIGSTIATNCVVERKGAKCCMICTKGFRDVLELSSRIPKDDPYNLRVQPPEYFIPRGLRFGVEERIQFDGQIITPLNENHVRGAVGKAREHNVEVPVICFLHSYMNPEHEEKAAEIMKNEYPNAVLSSHILRKHMEGHRFHTAVLAGYVKPMVANFVKTLTDRLKDNGYKGILLFVTCAGGVAAPEIFLDNPALMMGSGPAAGPLFASRLGELAGFHSIMSLDIGGTTVDLSILPERKITITTEKVVAGHRNALESVDVTSIGVGGGAIAWLDSRGVLHVGPQSAGADPGPACYGKGGESPTLTDADVLLGYIPADYFLGGRISLDIDRAQKAIEDGIAKPLGISVIQAAHAISSLAEENISKEIFLNFVKKGFDPREFTLIVGGGAGPVHGAALAERLSMAKLYIPRHAAVFCPLGILIADYKYILGRFYNRSGSDISTDDLRNHYLSLEQEGVGILKRQGLDLKNIMIVRGASIRYFGQLNSLDVLLPEISMDEPFTEENTRSLIDGFHKRHEAIYGRCDPKLPVTIETVKLHAIGKRHPIKVTREIRSEGDISDSFKRKRSAYFHGEGGFIEIPCYDGDRMRYGNTLMGPAIIEESKTTIVIPPQYRLTVDTYGNYEIKR